MIYSTREKAPAGTYKCGKCGTKKNYKTGETFTTCPVCDTIMWEKLV